MRTLSVEDFLNAQVSEATKRNYRFGMKTFAEWYRGPVQEILEEEDPGKTLEFYWSYLKKPCKGNSPRNKMNTIVQYCKFNRVNPEIRKGLARAYGMVFHSSFFSLFSSLWGR